MKYALLTPYILITLATLSLVLFCISAHYTIAQNTPAEDENYKHFNPVPIPNSNTFGSDFITLRNQKTHKRHMREFVIAPKVGLPNKSVQEKKTKSNYKINLITNFLILNNCFCFQLCAFMHNILGGNIAFS